MTVKKRKPDLNKQWAGEIWQKLKLGHLQRVTAKKEAEHPYHLCNRCTFGQPSEQQPRLNACDLNHAEYRVVFFWSRVNNPDPYLYSCNKFAKRMNAPTLDSLQIPPHDIDAEQAVLGSLFVLRECFRQQSER